METKMNHQSSFSFVEACDYFCRTPLDQLLTSSLSPEETVLALFQQVSERVPAYRAFLKQHHIHPKEITSQAAFRSLPLITKENYTRAFPLPSLCWDGEIAAMDFIACSSGSTGTPSFWLRRGIDELSITTRFEQIFQDAFQLKHRSTLAIVCFALGTWVGGMFTSFCCRYLAAKNYPLTVIAPGNHRDEILRVVSALAPHYEQIVLLGYPPFLKDVIDFGVTQGVDWPKYQPKLILAGEVFSEAWRDMVAERIGSTSPATDFSSLYGTADAAVLAQETPLSITIRRFLSQRPHLAEQLFGESRLPTLAQYDPYSRYFEEVEGTLVVTANNGMPLIRYHIADKGGIIPYHRMIEWLETQGLHLGSLLQSARQQPFVYLFGRANFVLSYFGANIFPEHISIGLEQPEINKFVSGKFVMMKEEGVTQRPKWKLVIELSPGKHPTSQLSEQIIRQVLAQLERFNSEFINYVPKEYQVPEIEFRATADAEYFPAGVKHRYTKA